ncbi:hypothetical protein [Arsenicicoccus dermatophilus]|uniref:hypothetical protein n=1 Tax=Arsenicicoccus dermatophilus TaxID=1076331 RepID=UPI001F4D348B|nr:hypothetical protein [Arsenicicoccus dermatophilus]MCH8613947.1 hypothetical protein [Arsenicicoccus dermatophilus]
MRKALAAVATAVAALAGGIAAAAPAQAATYPLPTSCPTRTTSPMLSRFGDTNEYFEVDNGSFASPTAGWDGSYGISPENEPWYVNPASSQNSLSLSTGAWAKSPDLCLSAGEETTRFFYKGTGQSGSVLSVKAIITSDTGVYTYNYRLDASFTGWRLSPVLSIPNYSYDGVQLVSLQFGNASTYQTARPIQVDDVLVDPWRAWGY